MSSGRPRRPSGIAARSSAVSSSAALRLVARDADRAGRHRVRRGSREVPTRAPRSASAATSPAFAAEYAGAERHRREPGDRRDVHDAAGLPCSTRRPATAREVRNADARFSRITSSNVAGVQCRAAATHWSSCETARDVDEAVQCRGRRDRAAPRRRRRARRPRRRTGAGRRARERGLRDGQACPGRRSHATTVAAASARSRHTAVPIPPPPAPATTTDRPRRLSRSSSMPSLRPGRSVRRAP